MLQEVFLRENADKEHSSLILSVLKYPQVTIIQILEVCCIVIIFETIVMFFSLICFDLNDLRHLQYRNIRMV